MDKRYAFVGAGQVADYVDQCLSEEGWARTELTEEAELVLTYCMHASALEDAYFEDDGIIKHARPGTMLVDLSPSTPSFARELAAIATVSDLVPIEAPLAFADAFAPDAFETPARALCFAAGEEKDVERALPVLRALSDTVICVGACGSGQLAKAAHTLQVTAQMLSSIEAEALYLAVRDSGNSVDRFDGATLAMTPIEEATLSAVRAERFKGAFTVEMLLGEVVAAMTAADDVDLILPQLEAAMHLLEVLAVVGGADMSPAALALLYRDEETSTAHGLDWTRAEIFNRHVHDDGCEGDDDDYDEYGYDDYDDLPGYGGFGRYSDN